MKYISIIVLFFCSAFCCAQNQEKLTLGNLKVLDAFFETRLDKARVSVLEKDSCTVLVDSMVVGSGGFFAIAPRRDAYVLKIVCENYPTTYQAISIPKNTGARYNYPKAIRLFQEMQQDLGEATVKASRILMVVKGDTLEYNAAAFRLAKGSMLDNLVRALPGVKLDDDGRITVNGEFVSSLLVNGRDFFNGDPRVALSNLPAYTVSKIRTYHKSEKAELMGKTELTEEEKKKSPLVMDVSLKREYAKGWISNYEAGGGTSITGHSGKKWLGRLFVMRYTNHSSLAVFAGSNNMNDAMSVSDKGEWKKADAAEGETRTHMGGINFTLNPKDGPFRFSTALQAKQQRRLGEIHENSEDYYSDVATFRESLAKTRSTHTDFQWNARVQWRKSGKYLVFDPFVSYLHRKGNDRNVALQLQSAGQVGVDTLYRRNLYEQIKGKTWNAGAKLYGFISLPRDQMLDFSQNISYNRVRQHAYAEDALRYVLPEQSSRQFRDRNNPLSGYRYVGNLLYQNYEVVKRNQFKLEAFFDYRMEQDYSSARQELLRASDDGLTPSVHDSREWLVDHQNSYYTTVLKRTHTFDPAFNLTLSGFYLSAHGTMVAHVRRIEDERAEHMQKKRKDDFTFDPEVSLGWENKVHTVELGGGISHELPEMIYLLDVTDSTDPLTVQKGNPDLKSTRRQKAYLSYKVRMKRNAGQLNLRAEFNRWLDKVAMAQLYDSRTGITTFRPMNVNGNRTFDANAHYSTSISKSGNWSLSNELGFRRARSVDFASASLQQEPVVHAVGSTVLKEDFRLDYRIRQMRIGTKATFAWTRQNSEQQLYRLQKYGTQGYGITFTSPLCWGIDFDTDLMVYKRFGYSEASMNTTDWVWNASLMKNLGERKQWTVKAIGFDLLRQLSSVRRDINAQGFVERSYNTIPSYVLFSLMYRLDIKPKKKEL